MLTSHKKKKKKKIGQPIKKKERWTLTRANRMLGNCQEDIRFCYDIRRKSYDKYDPCYAVPRM